MSIVCGRVAGIDVHKRILVVVVVDSADPNQDVAVGKFGTTHGKLSELVAFLRAHKVQQVAMESTAQYWRPVWMALEGEFALQLAQARSTRAPRGRKWDEADARRIARRLLADDLTVSYVPGPEQRDWRLLERTRVALTEMLIQVRNQIEQVLEQAQIKLTSVVSDVLGVSGRRMLQGLIAGDRQAAQLAELGHPNLRASREELADALSGNVTAAQRLVLRLYVEQIEKLEGDIRQLDQELAAQQSAHQQVIAHLALFLAIVSARRNRCWPRSGRGRRRLLLPASWPPGSASVQASRKAPASLAAHVRPKVIAFSGGCSARLPGPPSPAKAAKPNVVTAVCKQREPVRRRGL